MNILAKLGDAIDSTNHIESESVMALGLFGMAPPAATDDRGAPAYSAFSRRGSRQRRIG
ncbi:MAG: hypothetical protein IID51_03185 [Proteobacteria bacterium]|nr:hypothetical protein [Pseudomonadota bacterium]